MAYYPDLSQYTYGVLDPDCDTGMNVGWLDRGQEYPRGEAPPGFIEALSKLTETPMNLSRGYHFCPFCLDQLHPDKSAAVDSKLLFGALREGGSVGNGEILVRAVSGKCFLSPVLILHYVEAHEYLPPEEFIRTVLRVADPSSLE